MKWSVIKYLKPKSDLRQRSTHILYLVFLILIFSFIPGTTPIQTETSQDLVGIGHSTNSLSKTNTLLFLHLVKNETETYEALKFASLEIEQLTVNCIANVHRTQEVFGKQREPALSWMGGPTLPSSTADSLYEALINYRNKIVLSIGLDKEYLVKQILTVDKFVVDPSGELIPYYDYYFRDHNQQEVESYLSDLEYRVLQLESFALQQLIETVAKTIKDVDLFKDLKLNPSETVADIYENKGLNSFFESIKDNGAHKPTLTLGQKHDDFYIESYVRSNSLTEQALRYETHFNPNKGKLVVIITHAAQKEYYSLPLPGSFYYFAQQSGDYGIEFKQVDRSYTDNLSISLDQAKLIPTKLSVGIDNGVDMDQNLFQLPFELDIQSNNGTVMMEGGQLILTPSQLGSALLSISCLTPYGKVKVLERNYHVEAQALPELSLADAINGSSVTVNELYNATELNILNNASNYYSMVSFQLSIYNPSTGKSSSVYYNRSKNLSASIKRAFRELKSGDRIIIDRALVSAQANEAITLAPYIVHIK